MLNFNDAFNDIIGGIAKTKAVVQLIPVNPQFEQFKQWAVGYVQEHDELDPTHATLQQLQNMGSIDEIEQLLRHNHDYCDDCLLKMYRKYVSGEQNGTACGCGGE